MSRTNNDLNWNHISIKKISQNLFIPSALFGEPSPGSCSISRDCAGGGKASCEANNCERAECYLITNGVCCACDGSESKSYCP